MALTCTTAPCLAAASLYLSNLSPNHTALDPCVSFEEYACGGFQARTVLRPDEAAAGTTQNVRQDVQAIIRRILEGVYPGPPYDKSAASAADRENFNLLQGAYRACMDEGTVAAEGVKPLVALLDEAAGALNGSDFGAFYGWMAGEVMATPLVDFWVDQDDKEPERQVVKVSLLEEVGLPDPEYYKEAGTVAEYEKAIAAVLANVKPSKMDLGNVTQLATEIVRFESSVAAVIPSSEELQDPIKLYNSMPLTQAAALIPPLGLDKALTSLVPSNYSLTTVIVAFPDVLTKISGIINSMPTPVVRAFMLWTVIRYTARIVEKSPEVRPWIQLVNKLQGKAADSFQDRFRTCASHVINDDRGLGWILSRFFVADAFPPESKATGDQIVTDLRDVYVKKFEKLGWMSDGVKKAAIEKIKNLDQKIGYPEESPNILSPLALAAYYANLTLTPSYFSNSLRLSAASAARMWARLPHPTDPKRWSMPAAVVNANYDATHNDLTFPAGILQPPYFRTGTPPHAVYASFGVVAGHELSHAFDNLGRKYDARGRLADWWDGAAAAEFERRAQCYVKQYSSYKFEVDGGAEMAVNGAATLAENLADSLGVQAAYEAWKSLKLKMPEEKLPGMEAWSTEQAFFLAYANLWCTKYTPVELRRRIRTDVHAPNMARVMGPVANSRGFREAFGCTREPVCEMW